MIEVERAGLLTTVQDLGRPGNAHLGVPPSGAVDVDAARLANRLVGNEEGAAVLETTLAGPTLTLQSATTFAVTGAPAPVTLNGVSVPMGVPIPARSGSTLELGTATSGLRGYLALRGGIGTPLVLGSRSCDILTGLGGPPLADGDRLELADQAVDWPNVDVAPLPGLPAAPVLDVWCGPGRAWFATSALTTLTHERFTVEGDSNRVGLRLKGATIERARRGELPSQGLVTGAMQVPESGDPIVFLNDHPTTGGYPVLACLTSRALAVAAQLRPGDEIRFRLVPDRSSPVGQPPRQDRPGSRTG